jgi:hypothetical protein
MLVVWRCAVGASPSLLAELDRMPMELDRLVREVPAQLLRWQPEDSGGAPGETFSALGHVCHLRDIEADGYHVRVRRMLEEDRPSLVSIDGYELARERRYDEADLEGALVAFRTARGRTLDTLRALTDQQLARAGDFAEYGTLTLGALLRYLRSHDQQHLAGLQWLLGRIASRQPA